MIKIKVITISAFVFLLVLFSIPISAHPQDKITIAGGDSYEPYEINVDAPINNGYAQGIEQARQIFDPKGIYLSSDFITWPGGSAQGNVINDNILEAQQVSDGWLFIQNIKEIDNASSQQKLVKTDNNFTIVSTQFPLGEIQYFSMRFIGGQSPLESTYKLITNANELIEVDKSGSLVSGPTSLGIPAVSPLVGGSVPTNIQLNTSGWVSFAVVSPNHGYITAYKVDQNGYYDDYKQLAIPIDSGNTWFSVNFYPLDNGNILGLIGTNGNDEDTNNDQAVVLYDADLNVITNVAVGKNKESANYKALAVTADGNYIIRNYIEDVQNSSLIEVDKNTGDIIKQVDYFGSDTSFDVGTNLSNPGLREKYFFSGITNATGVFSGYGNERGTFIAAFDEDLHIVNVNLFESAVTHKFNGMLDLQNETILTYGQTNGGGDLFSIPPDGLHGAQEAFIGTFSQTIDVAPKLPSYSFINVHVDTEMRAEQIDKALLSKIEEDMTHGTEDIETNRYDDLTNNADLLKRVNKNIFNSEYVNTPIDWQVFGLEEQSETHSYAVGPNKNVTYSVTDYSLLQTTTSFLVNIIDENTKTDDETYIDSATSALHSEDIRVHINNLADLNYIEAGKVMAWQLTDGRIENNQVIVDNSNVKSAVGTYDVVFKYKGISSENKITIYDEEVSILDDIQGGNILDYFSQVVSRGVNFGSTIPQPILQSIDNNQDGIIIYPYSNNSLLTTFAWYLSLGLVLMFFIIPIILFSMLYYRSNKLYKKTESLFYKE